jgi:hypothetical protein
MEVAMNFESNRSDRWTRQLNRSVAERIADALKTGLAAAALIAFLSVIIYDDRLRANAEMQTEPAATDLSGP